MLPTSSQYVYVTDANNFPSTLESSGQESVHVVTPVEVIPVDPSAPILSTKNPLRLVANNGQYISLDGGGNPNVQRVVQILNAKNIVKKEGSVNLNYDNKNIVCNVYHANRNQFLQSAISQATSQSSVPRRRGRRPGRKNKTRDDDDPDYVPDLPEELLTSYPLQHSPSSGQMSVYSDRNFDPEYDDTSELESYSSSTSNEFLCEICSRSFQNKAGLSRHKMLKHSGKKISVGPKVDPARRAQLRYDNLKSALEKASAEDIIELAAPYVAQHVSLWNYLFLRTEFANKSTGEVNVSQLPVPPPEMPLVVAEYLGFVDKFRENFPKISQRIKDAKRPADDADDQEAEIDEKLLGSFGPGPTSAKRRRYLAFKKKLESTMNDVNQTVDGVDVDGGENGVIEVKDSLQSCVLGVIMGRYKIRQNLSPGSLPSRYAVADYGYPEIVNLDETFQQQPQDKQEQLSQSTESNSNGKDKTPKPAPKKAMVITGVQPETVDMVQEVDHSSCPEIEEPQNNAQQAGDQSNDNVVGGGHVFDGPIPEELIANGTYIPLTQGDGGSTEYVYHFQNGYVYNRRTGRVATDDEVTIYQNPPTETVYVQAITETASILTMPDGTQIQVQHGPDGVTSELFNMILHQLRSEDSTNQQ
nr:zinc finger C2H2 type [Hymenolepis microstoma]